MTDRSLPVSGAVTFEELKKTNEHGAEFWSARELQPLLGYGQWRRFEDAGYKGLYNGLGNEGIKQRKGIPKKDNLMDRMDTTELAANQFRMTQTRDKLARTPAKDQQQAIRTHEAVGREVREAIKRIGGAMPENIPPAEHISNVEKRIKNTPPFLELDGSDAKWLVGSDGWLENNQVVVI